MDPTDKNHSGEGGLRLIDRANPMTLAIPLRTLPAPSDADGKLNERVFTFGDFIVLPSQRQLLRSGVVVPVGSRAFDILLVLLTRPGEIFSKEDLISRVWPNTYVEEANLKVHISALRKTLGTSASGSRFIENVPGRGYCFVAPVDGRVRNWTRAGREPTPFAGTPKVTRRAIGREDVIDTLVKRLDQSRLITVVGAGGIGKTTVALEVATMVAPKYSGDVIFVDLTTVSDTTLVTEAVAVALEPEILSGDRSKSLESLLRGRVLLLVLDNCEHVIESVAELAETVLRTSPDATILATSREPLRVEGEWVQRLPPLAFPNAAGTLTAAVALEYPAIQLFMERAAYSLGGYELTDIEAPLVARICERLDGIALAIELAVGHLDAIGVRGLASSLDDGFEVLTRGRRTALNRHQKMWATLDWSYNLLSDSERTIFKGLAVFKGGFTADAAREIIDGVVTIEEFDEGLANLVSKSLVVADTCSEPVRYRLFETTQAYARTRLDETDSNSYGRRHARFFLRLFERPDEEWHKHPTNEWVAACAAELANLRAALDWAFAPDGDAELGIALTVAGVPLWTQRSMVDEWKVEVTLALTTLDALPTKDLRRKMQLLAALGCQQMHAGSGLPVGAAETWEATLEIAETLGDDEYQLRALWALWIAWINKGEQRAALGLVDRFDARAAVLGDAGDRSIGDRIRAKNLHFIGDQRASLKYGKRMLDRYTEPTERSDIIRFQYDQRILARATLARVLWIQGFPDLALRETHSLIHDAISLDHILTVCNAIVDAAFPLALLCGDIALAESYKTRLFQLTEAHSLDIWNTYAQGFEGQLLLRSGKLDEGVSRVRSAIEKLERTGFVLYRTSFVCTLAQGLSDIGRYAEALDAIDGALARCQSSGEGWCLAELRRIRGAILAAGGGPNSAMAAEADFALSLSIAREQGALCWALRTAIDLAKLLNTQGRKAEAAEILSFARGQISEGFGTADMLAADRLLNELSILARTPHCE